MSQYVAFLRGMNLGRRRITNQALCAAVAALGFHEVSAFLASGNVIFRAARRTPAQVASRIEEGLRAAFDYEVPTFVRTAKEVRSIAEHFPFPEAQVVRSKGKLQVAMLARKPTARQRKTVLDMATEKDRLALDRRELYWLPSGPLLESDLDLKTIERTLGPLTMRTRRTLERIAAKHLGA